MFSMVVLGCGDRGKVYADYSLSYPNEMEIVGLVDVSQQQIHVAKERYHVEDSKCFLSLDDFLKAHIACDVVVNATQDSYHFDTTMALLKANYNVLLEKPITPNPEQTLMLQKTAKEHGCKVLICHVLRYSPFYLTMKKMIKNGDIGKIVSIEANEHVGVQHAIGSFIRGPWKSEDECGSPFLLAKCCHDTDILCWLNGDSKPKYVYSTGSRQRFTTKNRPEGASENCYTCKRSEDCLYACQRMHRDQDIFIFQTYGPLMKKLKKEYEEIDEKTKVEYLRNTPYAECVYKDRDLIDRQVVNVEFENGSVVNFSLIAGTPHADRYIHIVGEDGEIEGKIEDMAFTYRKFVYENHEYKTIEKRIDVKQYLMEGTKELSGHGGGDFPLVYDMIQYIKNLVMSDSLTLLEDSLIGHFVVYTAEESRKTGKRVDFAEYFSEKERKNGT